jgi:hypothetical protein
MDRIFRRAVALTGIAVLFAACTNSEAEVSTNGDRLARAGFIRRNADTPERVAALQALPPLRFAMRDSNGSVKYMYADPITCDCIYVGGQRAYDQYRQEAASRLTKEELRAFVVTEPLPGESDLW